MRAKPFAARRTTQHCAGRDEKRRRILSGSTRQDPWSSRTIKADATERHVYRLGQRHFDTRAQRAGQLADQRVGGGVLVIVVLWLFIGWRNSILTAIGIPIAFSLAFIMLKAIGSSINENTLFGLVLVLGMVVDDAIVVIENVYRYLQMGYERSDAVITGTQEVLSPVLTSTLTTIAAFMPLVLLPGTIGEFLKVVPITVSLALLASLVECFLILPSHIADFGGGQQKSRLDGTIGRLTERYTRLVSVFFPLGDAMPWPSALPRRSSFLRASCSPNCDKSSLVRIRKATLPSG